MEEDAPNLIVVLVINIIIFIVIPLVMAYRRGYLFNISEHFNWIKGLFAQKNQCLPLEWTIVGIRQLSAFEKYQIHKILTRVRDNESPNGCSEKRHRLSGDPVGSPDFLPSCLPPEDELPA